MILKANPENPNIRNIKRAVEALNDGGLVAYATDTNYGLGCDIHNKHGMERALALKGYSKYHALSFLCADLSDISKYARVETSVYKILKRCLPGAFTFILPATREVPKLLLSKRKTVGLRVPDHPVAQVLLKEFGRPVLSTGCTDHKGEMMNDPELIHEEWGHEIDIVLDSGILIGESSTIVDLTDPDHPEVLRAGKGDVALLG
ncbi:threonylcarbamoyl-AMP synthase [bacterium]|nr:threonylcarbamoyl-AMP synthase [bacterium]MBU1638495.1 threonylcarbamoyl-AMP synthase [bacterium]MBU1919354.1 threonylcarbamoyl-AMP synthase [bacterium]